MSVFAPITAVEAAAVPLLFGLLTGDRPGPLALVGIASALVAVTLVSSAPDPDAGAGGPKPGGPGTNGIFHALGAGLAFGAFFIFLGGASGGGLWPLAGARASSLALIAIAVLVTRTPLSPAPGTGMGIAGSGLFDAGANLLYLLATREGLLSLVAVLTSMYPAMTVLLARVVLKERMQPVQVAGLGLALVSVALITLG